MKNKKIDPDKLDGYLRANGGLTAKQAAKIVWWSFFNFKRNYYFYLLCEDGYGNFIAFNKARKESMREIKKYIKEKENGNTAENTVG